MGVIELVPIGNVAADAVEAVLDRAFGADRHGRTAYRVRLGTEPIAELSFAALDGGVVIGTIQCWPVALAVDGGGAVPMIMVGPVAVLPDRQRDGIGRLLTARTIAAVEGSADPGRDALMLIGDPEYYGRFFGFEAARTGGWRLPGPFEPRRLLARGSAVPDRPGLVGPRVLAAA